jgi:hypothetical protein
MSLLDLAKKCRSLAALGMTSLFLIGLPAIFGLPSQSPAAPGSQQPPSISPTPTQPADERSDSLRAQGQGSKSGDRARIFMELAQRDVELADREFDAGTSEQAQKLIQQSVTDAQTAADAAIESGSRLKNTEMEMHRLARRLADVEQSLGVDDRPPVKAAAEKVQDLDRALLERMFRHKSKAREPEKK